jgi:hypothetical protein
LVCANDVNLLRGNIKKITEMVTDANKVVGLEVNTEKTKYMMLSHHQNAEKS